MHSLPVNLDRIRLDLPERDGRLTGGVRFDTQRSRNGVDECVICGESPRDDWP